MSQDFGNRLVTGRALAERAATVAREALASVQFAAREKGAGDLVTDIDLANERMIRDRIAAEFPADAVLGEEDGGQISATGFCWLIDPVDGTVNFVRRLPYCCVSLCLLRDAVPVAAWIVDTLSGECFHAGPDGRFLLNGAPLPHDPRPAESKAVVGLGFSDRHDPGLCGNVTGALECAGIETRRLGAGALCLAHAAAGRLDGYLEPHMQPWDAVGGLYLAACAGLYVQPYWTAGNLETGGPTLAVARHLVSRLAPLLPPPFAFSDTGQDAAGAAPLSGRQHTKAFDPHSSSHSHSENDR